MAGDSQPAPTSPGHATPSTPATPAAPGLSAAADIPWITVMVHDGESAGLAEWAADALISGLPALARPPSAVRYAQAAPAGFVEAATKAAEAGLPAGGGLLVVAVFYDGRSELSRAQFELLKGWAGKTGAQLQAINGKKGKHHFWMRSVDIALVEESLVQIVGSKLAAVHESRCRGMPPRHRDPASAATALHDPATPASEPVFRVPSASTVGSAASVPGPETDDRLHYCISTEEEMEQVIAQISLRVRDGQGETVLHLGVDEAGTPVGIEPAMYSESVETLGVAARRMQCGISTVCEKVVKGDRRCGELLVRRDNGESYIDMRVAVCGNVDSGKSTLVGVLTRGQWDDGRGAVRAKVFNHKHEQDSGRTSSISEQFLGFDARGNTVNYAKVGQVERDRKISNRELSDRSAKVFTLYDLAGHERYLKTTVLGMTGTAPDYACIVISANNGIQRMTKEHLGLCLALRIPFFVVITRIDATPGNVLQSTVESVTKMLKLPSVRKLPYFIKRMEDVYVCAKNVKEDRVAPIFQVSNVSGAGIEELLRFLNLAPVRRDWGRLAQMPKELVIDSTFYVSGVGTVVGGIVTQGTFKTGDSVLLGPNGHGQFRSVQIKSIQVKGVDAAHVEAGSDAAFALKKERRSAIRKGNVLLDTKLQPPPHACWEFQADVIVLYHSTTIKSNYEPVIHCSAVRQSAKITLVDTDVLRTGDKAKVRFRFLYRPEYMRIGAKLVFREGRTKGLGTVTWIGEATGQMGPKTAKGRTVKDREEDAPAAAAG
eukprot:TRINITY_DN7638_c0_g1_i1.p1 TRINITY_DN7638_c0_g1~~TRINITY_DN7638_c0_g1_i1.p1  ORF type:complete len:772 (+),score=240.78 TRINITY_DN7638_c0_g1_i1:129-2444(+)